MITATRIDRDSMTATGNCIDTQISLTHKRYAEMLEIGKRQSELDHIGDRFEFILIDMDADDIFDAHVSYFTNDYR